MWWRWALVILVSGGLSACSAAQQRAFTEPTRAVTLTPPRPTAVALPATPSGWTEAELPGSYPVTPTPVEITGQTDPTTPPMFTPSSTATLWPTPTDLADGIRIPDEQLVDAVYDLAFIEATERLVLDTLLLTQAEELTLVDANYAMMLAMMWLSLGVDPAVVPPPPDNRLEPAWTQVQTARNQVVLALSPVMSAADTQMPPQISEDDLIATVSTSLEVTSQALDDLGAQWHTAYGWSPSSLADLRAVAYESHSELMRPARPTAIYR